MNKRDRRKLKSKLAKEHRISQSTENLIKLLREYNRNINKKESKQSSNYKSNSILNVNKNFKG